MSRKLEEPYAEALFLLSSSDETLKKWAKELKALLELWEKNPELNRFFSSKIISEKEKEKFLEKLFKKEMDADLFSFLIFLCQKNRLTLIDKIAASFLKLVKKHFDVLEATLITSEKADDSLKKILMGKLEKAYPQKIDLVEKIDPQIVGGFILKIGDKFIDASIKARLYELENQLLSLHL